MQSQLFNVSTNNPMSETKTKLSFKSWLSNQYANGVLKWYYNPLFGRQVSYSNLVKDFAEYFGAYWLVDDALNFTQTNKVKKHVKETGYCDLYLRTTFKPDSTAVMEWLHWNMQTVIQKKDVKFTDFLPDDAKEDVQVIFRIQNWKIYFAKED